MKREKKPSAIAFRLANFVFVSVLMLGGCGGKEQAPVSALSDEAVAKAVIVEMVPYAMTAAIVAFGASIDTNTSFSKAQATTDIGGFGCEVNGTVVTCACPGGGDFVTSISANPTNLQITDTNCPSPDESFGDLWIRLNGATFTTAYNDCVVTACGQSTTLSGSDSGTVSGDINLNCNGLIDLDATVQTAQNCSGYIVKTVSGTTTSSTSGGSSVSVRYAGGVKTGVSGAVCAQNQETTFGCLVDLLEELQAGTECVLDTSTGDYCETGFLLPNDGCPEGCTCQDQSLSIQTPGTCQRPGGEACYIDTCGPAGGTCTACSSNQDCSSLACAAPQVGACSATGCCDCQVPEPPPGPCGPQNTGGTAQLCEPCDDDGDCAEGNGMCIDCLCQFVAEECLP